MEASEIPVYSLSEILSMNEGWIARFLERLAIPESDDALGQIILTLANSGKLTYLPPINSDNLRGLIKVTTPSEIISTIESIRAAGVMPSVNRLELMKQYLSYATVSLAESPRFLPVVRPTSPITPVYSLSEILTMNEGWVDEFQKKLGIADSDDPRGQIALALDNLDILTYLPPITKDNLPLSIDATRPFKLDRLKYMVEQARVTPSTDRLGLMEQYIEIIGVPETKPALPLVTLEAIDWRTELTALINLLNKFSGEVIQQIVKNYSYRRIRKICWLIPRVLADESLKIPSTTTEKLQNLNRLLCNSQFFWRLKTQHDFGVTKLSWHRTWLEEYRVHLQKLQLSLVQAVEDRNIVKVKELLEFGVDPNGRGKDYYSPEEIISRQTAIEIAVKLNEPNMVKLLLVAGANPNIYSKYEESPISIATNYGDIEIVKLLIPHVNRKSRTQALFSAVNNGHIGVVKLLLAAGVNIRRVSRALTSASRKGHIGIVRLLLTAGVRFNIYKIKQDKAIIEASRNGHIEVVRLLLAVGADPNIQESRIGTALTAILRRRDIDSKYIEIIKLLLAAGADPNIPDESGNTAIDYARLEFERTGKDVYRQIYQLLTGRVI
uniref:Ankyrin repeat protein n=1 Tax=Pithovirus LCPAC103 TaxID=2506588 RepID=A0A481Z3J7_9VIRU|nr:MAG: ankyrin repeat protein [Pithovirus LCPAC103]